MPQIESIKTAIRPGITIWALCIATLKFLGYVEIASWEWIIIVSAIAQWIPDRAIHRIKDAIKS